MFPLSTNFPLDQPSVYGFLESFENRARRYKPTENRDGGETELRVCLFRGDTKYRPDTRLVRSLAKPVVSASQILTRIQLTVVKLSSERPQTGPRWDDSRSSICCHSNKNKTHPASPAALAVIRLGSGLPCATTAAIGAYHKDSPCHWMLRMQVA